MARDKLHGDLMVNICVPGVTLIVGYLTLGNAVDADDRGNQRCDAEQI